MLKDISAWCDQCQRNNNRPKRFCVLNGTNKVTIKKKILMDIMYIARAPNLRISDEAKDLFSGKGLVGSQNKRKLGHVRAKLMSGVHQNVP